MIVTFSPKAQQDISDIWDYTATQWGLKKAEQYIYDLEEKCRFIASMPLQGRSVPHIRKGYYSFHYEKHVIFYNIIDTASVTIVRILHQSMDISSHLDNDIHH